MLDKMLLASEIERLSDSLFLDTSKEYRIAQKAWESIGNDPHFLQKILAAHAPWPVPLWQGNVHDTISLDNTCDTYYACSVDGSQIYPDRHYAISCYLINIGSVLFHYNSVTTSRVEFDSIPSLFTGYNPDSGEYECSRTIVNCHRQECEFKKGLELAKHICNQKTFAHEPCALLFDGSLIFWHLASVDADVKDRFLSQYLQLLDELHKERLAFACYISMPKSKELVNLVRLFLSDFAVPKDVQNDPIRHVVDSAIVRTFLPPYHRTTIFENRSDISTFYSAMSKPYFFYVHSGTEIGRVEIPAWIAQNEALVNQIGAIIIDQCKKGNGYPVVLAEAHEQAVVKGPDRDFFYHMLNRAGKKRQKSLLFSAKNAKKLRMNI